MSGTSRSRRQSLSGEVMVRNAHPLCRLQGIDTILFTRPALTPNLLWVVLSAFICFPLKTTGLAFFAFARWPLSLTCFAGRCEMIIFFLCLNTYLVMLKVASF